MSMSPYGKENTVVPAQTPPSALKRRHERTPLASRTPQESPNLPPEFNIPTDSPALKKSRMSRVSFGGVQMKVYIKDTSSSTSTATEPVTDGSPTVSSESLMNDSVSLACSSQEATEPIPSLSEVLATDEDAVGFQGSNPCFDAGDETKPVPNLQDLGNLDCTETIQSAGSGDREHTATLDVTQTIDGEIIETTSCSMGSAPSLKNLLQRAANPTESPPVISTVHSSDGEDDSMEITACYGQIQIDTATNRIPDDGTFLNNMSMPVVGNTNHSYANATAKEDVLQGAPALPIGQSQTTESLCTESINEKKSMAPVCPSLAAASATTFVSAPPNSPNLTRLLAFRESPNIGRSHGSMELAGLADHPNSVPSEEVHLESDVGIIGRMIPIRGDGQAVGIEGAEQNVERGVKAAPVSYDSICKSPFKTAVNHEVSGLPAAVRCHSADSPAETNSTPPALMRAGSRLTITPSGISSFRLSHDSLDATDNKICDEEKHAPDNAGADSVPSQLLAVNDCSGRQVSDDAETVIPTNIEDKPLQSPMNLVQKPLNHPSWGQGAVLKDMMRRRSSMMTLSSSDDQKQTHHISLNAPITDATERIDAVSDSKLITCQSFSSFLAAADLHFLDDLSTNRRETLMVRRSTDPPESLEECKLLLHTTLPELASLQNGCDEITTMIHSMQTAVSNVEAEVNRNPPEVFAQLAANAGNSDSSRSCSVITALRGQLATLKRICRQEAKLAWYDWYGAMAKTMEDNAEAEKGTLFDELSHIADRISLYKVTTGELCAFMTTALGVQPLHGESALHTPEDLEELTALENEARAQCSAVTLLKEQMHERRARFDDLVLAKTGLQSEITELMKLKNSLVCGTNATSEASLSEVDEAMASYEHLQHITGVTLTTVVKDRVVMQLHNLHSLEIVCEDKIITHANLRTLSGKIKYGTTGHEIFLRELIENAEIDRIVLELCGKSRTAICPTANELCFRIGHCIDLTAELKEIEQKLQLLVHRGKRNITVFFSSVSPVLKFQLTFSDMSFHYPSSAQNHMSVALKGLIGDVPVADIHAAVEASRHGGHRQIYKICEEVILLSR
eukprot:SAG11_NODE_1007_length_6206_cov_36.144752_4_plen_1079_part_00